MYSILVIAAVVTGMSIIITVFVAKLPISSWPICYYHHFFLSSICTTYQFSHYCWIY